jgi:hypothetical protein
MNYPDFAWHNSPALVEAGMAPTMHLDLSGVRTPNEFGAKVADQLDALGIRRSAKSGRVRGHMTPVVMLIRNVGQLIHDEPLTHDDLITQQGGEDRETGARWYGKLSPQSPDGLQAQINANAERLHSRLCECLTYTRRHLGVRVALGATDNTHGRPHPIDEFHTVRAYMGDSFKMSDRNAMFDWWSRERYTAFGRAMSDAFMRAYGVRFVEYAARAGMSADFPTPEVYTRRSGENPISLLADMLDRIFDARHEGHPYIWMEGQHDRIGPEGADAYWMGRLTFAAKRLGCGIAYWNNDVAERDAAYASDYRAACSQPGTTMLPLKRVRRSNAALFAEWMGPPKIIAGQFDCDLPEWLRGAA